MSKRSEAIQRWVHLYWFDGVCLLLSVMFFTLFLRNSLGMNTSALGYRTRVGNLMSGTVNRKSVDAPVFTEIRPESAVFDRDAIWAPSNSGTVQIRLIDQTLFDISPGTLVVLKKQENLKAPGLSVDVIAGSVEIKEISHQVAEGFTQFKVGDKAMPASDLAKGSKLSTAKEAANPAPTNPASQAPFQPPQPSPTPIPAGAPSAAPSPNPQGAGDNAGAGDSAREGAFHPREGMKYLVMMSKAMDVTFSWPGSARGDLVVRPAPGSAGQKAGFTEVRAKAVSSSATHVTLKVGSLYEWSIVDASGKALFGPHQFSVEPYSNAQVLDNVGGSDQGMVEIVQ